MRNQVFGIRYPVIQITDYRLLITDYRLPNTSYLLSTIIGSPFPLVIRMSLEFGEVEIALIISYCRQPVTKT